jgi:uncharacterized metal-binding protein
MSEGKRKVMLVPCSGLGKSLGTVSREAAYEVLEDLRPDETGLTPLSLLVLGDEETRAALTDNVAVAIDGCKLACASKMVEESGGRLVRNFAVLEAYRRHRDFRPRGIAELNEGGKKLAHALAEEIAEAVDRLSNDGEVTPDA